MPLTEQETLDLRAALAKGLTAPLVDFLATSKKSLEALAADQAALRILAADQVALKALADAKADLVTVRELASHKDALVKLAQKSGEIFKVNQAVARMNMNKVGKIDLNSLVLGAAVAALSVQAFKLDYSAFKVDEKGFHIVGVKSHLWPWIKKRETKKKDIETDKMQRSGQDPKVLRARVDSLQRSLGDLPRRQEILAGRVSRLEETVRRVMRGIRAGSQRKKGVESLARRALERSATASGEAESASRRAVTAKQQADRAVRNAGTAKNRADLALRKANSAFTRAGIARSGADAAAREVRQLRTLSRSTRSEVDSLRIAVHNLNNALR